jgi:hypothetical protein
MVVLAWIVGGIIWLIGAGITADDLHDNGKNVKQYREKYGKDLGLLVCCTYWGSMIAAWPVMGFGGFLVGIVRDGIRLILGKGPKSTEK